MTQVDGRLFQARKRLWKSEDSTAIQPTGTLLFVGYETPQYDSSAVMDGIFSWFGLAGDDERRHTYDGDASGFNVTALREIRAGQWGVRK